MRKRTTEKIELEFGRGRQVVGTDSTVQYNNK